MGNFIHGTYPDRKLFWVKTSSPSYKDEIVPGPSLAAFNHSPDGFEWGYGGSGPAQTALAILMRYLPTDIAVRHHQEFKWAMVATLEQGKDFVLTENEVLAWIDLNVYGVDNG